MAFNIFAVMKSLPPFFLWILLLTGNSILYAQKDTIIGMDSLRLDSISKAAIIALPPSKDTVTYKQYMVHPYLPMGKTPVFMVIDYKLKTTKDLLFYLILGVVFLLAFIKFIFPKFFKNIFLLFFQTSLRQKQTREQLLQDSWASLLINLLFILSAGLFVTLLAKYKLWSSLPFWNLYAYTSLLVILIYGGKFLFIHFSGWVFNNKEAAQSYVFLVSMVNRIMGILLIPFSVFLAFASTALSPIVVTISLGLVFLLFVYRYLVSFGSLRNDLKINPFHFFIYLCAVEIVPMVLMYKLMVNYIG